MKKIYWAFPLLTALLAVACGGGHEEGTKGKSEENSASLPEIERAVGALNHGDAVGAIAVLDSLTKYGNKDVVTHWRREISLVKAYALDGIDSTAKAKEFAARALALPPRDGGDHEALFRDYAYAASVFFYDKEREEDAIAWCRKALEHAKACEHDPGSTFVNLLLGNLYLHQAKPMEALALYQEALREAATPAAEAEYSIQLCNIYKRYGLFEEANRAADIALKNVMSGAVEHAKMKCSALAVKGFCMIALAPDSAMTYLKQAEEAAKVLPYNSGQVEVDFYAALHFAINEKDSMEEETARLQRIIEKSSVESKRAEAQAILKKLSCGEGVELVCETDRITGGIARALLSQSETLHAIMQENEERAHRNEVMRAWNIAIGAVALLVIAVLAALLIHLRHRERKARLIRQHAEKEAQMQHDLNEATRRRVIDELTPESLKEIGFEVFRSQFAARYPGALERLISAADTLGPREQLLCILLILGVDSQRLPDLLAIAPDSVKKSRQRIRRKLNLPSDQDLVIALRDIAQVKIEESAWEVRKTN